MSNDVDFGSIADSVGDGASFEELTDPGRDVRVQEEPMRAPDPELAGGDYEAADEPSTKDHESEIERTSEASEQQEAPEAPELVEREWYGKKVKLDKEADEYINSFFTRKSQEIAEEKRRVQEEAEQRIKEAQRLREEVERQRAEIQAHLDANPEFAESWNFEAKAKERNTQFEKLQETVQSLEQRLESERLQQQFDHEVATAKETYKLSDRAKISVDDAQKLALSQVITSNGQIPFTQAWQDVVGRYNRDVKDQGLGKLKQALETKDKTQGLTSRRNSGGKAEKVKPKTFDELVEYHMSLPDEYFER